MAGNTGYSTRPRRAATRAFRGSGKKTAQPNSIVAQTTQARATFMLFKFRLLKRSGNGMPMRGIASVKGFGPI
jgi:hypothetical protein